MGNLKKIQDIVGIFNEVGVMGRAGDGGGLVEGYLDSAKETDKRSSNYCSRVYSGA